MAGVALSRLKIPPHEFYSLSPAEFYHALKDFQDGEENEVKAYYEAIRRQTTFFVNTQVSRQYTKPEKLWPLPWDKSQAAQTVEEMKEEFKRIAVSMGGTINTKN